MKLNRNFYAVFTVVSSFLMSVIFLWPLRLIMPIADDLHLITQGSGTMRRYGFMHVLDLWTDFSLSSAHLTPIGGVWSAIYVWITNQLALRTPLTLASAWGVMRVLTIAIAIQGALHFGRSIARWLKLSSSFDFVLLLVLLATIQVHGYWSNDPVISFPIASWAFCIIGFYFLSFLLRATHSESWPKKSSAYIAIALAFLGILTYELFIAFLAAGFLLVGWRSIFQRGWRNKDFYLLLAATVLPTLLLLLGQVARLSSGSSYVGTEISVQSASIFKMFFVAVISTLPLTNLHLTHLLVPQGKIVATQFWTSFVVLIMLTAWSVRSKKLNNYRTSRIDITSVLSAMFALSVVATAVIIVTPKYQSELNGIVGRVYINYAPAWIATSLIISLFLGLMLNLNRRLFAIVGLLLIPIAGAWQMTANLRQVAALTQDSSWSKQMLTLLEAPIPENLQRCSEFDRLFSLPLPEYYQSAIYEGLQESYNGTYGVPYCDYENLGTRSAVSVRNVTGIGPVEFLAGGEGVFWSNSEQVAVDITYRGTQRFIGLLEVRLEPTPCLIEYKVIVKIGDHLPQGLVLTNQAVTASRLVALNPNQVIKVSIQQSGEFCRIPTDPRSFMPLLMIPRLVNS
jgi:hypothetical protein